jgi:hypothetical protein
MSAYDKEKTARYKAFVLQRIDNEKLTCPCSLLKYCEEASRTNNLLACELSDASCRITLETSGHAKFGDCEDDGAEVDHWYMTGRVWL